MTPEPGFKTLGEAAGRLFDDLNHLSRCPVTGIDTRHANEPCLAIPFQSWRPTIYASRSVAPDDSEAYVLPLARGMSAARILRVALFLCERRAITPDQLLFVFRWIAANFGDELMQAELVRDPREGVT